jgi:hypothetical protein
LSISFDRSHHQHKHTYIVINTGIGWHEARIPTIATLVPPGTFSFVTEQLKPHVSLPLVTSNRINTPAVAEKVSYFLLFYIYSISIYCCFIIVVVVV